MTNSPDPLPPDSEQEWMPPYPEYDSSQIDLSYPKNRIRLGLALAIVGYLIFLLGARPSIFGLDRSPVVGFVQISVFLVGLAVISLGSYLTLNALWPEGTKTIAAEIGSRLISTGYVICVFTGMADIFGLGSHPLPNVFFGPLQARGLAIGMGTIAVGLLLLIRYKRSENNGNHISSNNQETIEAAATPKPDDEGKISVSLKTLFQ
jgi:hypothetical protein